MITLLNGEKITSFYIYSTHARGISRETEDIKLVYLGEGSFDNNSDRTLHFWDRVPNGVKSFDTKSLIKGILLSRGFTNAITPDEDKEEVGPPLSWDKTWFYIGKTYYHKDEIERLILGFDDVKKHVDLGDINEIKIADLISAMDKFNTEI